jgi:hypothetical protein
MLIAPFSLSAAHYPDTFQITPKFREIVSPFHRHVNCIPLAAIRWPDFGNRHALGRQFGFIGLVAMSGDGTKPTFALPAFKVRLPSQSER